MILKVNNARFLNKYLGIDEESTSKLLQTADALGFHFPAASLELLSSKAVKASEAEEASSAAALEVKMGQVVRVTPVGSPKVMPARAKYVGQIGYNPKLAELGIVNCPAVVSQGQEISLTFKAWKNVDLSELEYLFTIYISE